MESARNRGFTLIEVLVVIAIIGILAAMVLASLNGSRTAARDSVRISDMRQIQSALELYANEHGYLYPTSLGLLIPPNGNYFTTLPVDPQTGTAYSYTAQVSSITNCTANGGIGGAFGKVYHLGASLENTGHVTLLADMDAASGVWGALAVCGSKFSGLSAAAGGAMCTLAAGTAQPSGTESCYDVLSQ